MPRYVILEHDHPIQHWDLMLETGPSLLTWRLVSPPILDDQVRAESLPDHRVFYLDYEGPISDGRGIVQAWDAGTFNFLLKGKDKVQVYLKGDRCRGVAELNKQPQGEWYLKWKEDL